MQSNDGNSVAAASNSQRQYTYRGAVGGFNNTGQNWRKLITPAHDSFKKLQNQKPEYSGGLTNELGVTAEQ